MNVSSGEGGGKGGSQDVELNLAPIIDCFTVLITFMLVSASFLAIGIFDAGISAAGQSKSDAKKPAVLVEVELLEGNEIHFKVSGKAKIDKTLRAAAGDMDLDNLKGEIENAKKNWPDTQSVVLSGKNKIEYLSIIRAMEKLRESVPVVLLGGF